MKYDPKEPMHRYASALLFIVDKFGFIGEDGDAKPFLKKRFCTPKNFKKGGANSGLTNSMNFCKHPSSASS